MQLAKQSKLMVDIINNNNMYKTKPHLHKLSHLHTHQQSDYTVYRLHIIYIAVR